MMPAGRGTTGRSCAYSRLLLLRRCSGNDRPGPSGGSYRQVKPRRENMAIEPETNSKMIHQWDGSKTSLPLKTAEPGSQSGSPACVDDFWGYPLPPDLWTHGVSKNFPAKTGCQVGPPCSLPLVFLA